MEDDGNVEALRELLENRKEAHGKEEDLANMWGVDELDELEEEAEGEEDEEDEAEITKDNIASLAKDVDQLVSELTNKLRPLFTLPWNDVRGTK